MDFNNYDLIINPPAITSERKEAYYRSLTTEQTLENNRLAVKQAVEAPTDKTLEEYYSSLKQPWGEDESSSLQERTL